MKVYPRQIGRRQPARPTVIQILGHDWLSMVLSLKTRVAFCQQLLPLRPVPLFVRNPLSFGCRGRAHGVAGCAFPYSKERSSGTTGSRYTSSTSRDLSRNVTHDVIPPPYNLNERERFCLALHADVAVECHCHWGDSNLPSVLTVLSASLYCQNESQQRRAPLPVTSYVTFLLRSRDYPACDCDRKKLRYCAP